MDGDSESSLTDIEAEELNELRRLAKANHKTIEQVFAEQLAESKAQTDYVRRLRGEEAAQAELDGGGDLE